ncbi:MAG: hypothetical protein MRQ09_02800 [Candidatus Midichloria sp.]|nr:hypothetical protein [Candidatus Midichloria sp.]
MVGDHDLSTGNFMLIAENPNSLAKIGRIDFGHAFNDLIKNWYSDHSPSLQSKGAILDALNRDKVNGDTNKFRRYFQGVIPDESFAEALERIDISQDKLINTLQS